MLFVLSINFITFISILPSDYTFSPRLESPDILSFHPLIVVLSIIVVDGKMLRQQVPLTPCANSSYTINLLLENILCLHYTIQEITRVSMSSQQGIQFLTMPKLHGKGFIDYVPMVANFYNR